MTLYHFGNCLALVYVPYYLTYKYSGLSEYGAFWKCIQAGGIYIFTQLVKMLALATFFPTADNVGEEGFDVFGEFLKSSIDLADLVGILLVLNSIPGKGHAKVLTAGIGWAGAEVLLTRFLLLWVGARGAEFDWKYIQKSLESNINLVQHITTATLVWLWSRHDLRRGLVPIVVCMLVLTVYRPLMLDFLSSFLLAGPWSTLIIKAITTFLIGATTLHIYAAIALRAYSYCVRQCKSEMRASKESLNHVILNQSKNRVMHCRMICELKEHIRRLRFALPNAASVLRVRREEI